LQRIHERPDEWKANDSLKFQLVRIVGIFIGIFMAVNLSASGGSVLSKDPTTQNREHLKSSAMCI
jgi:hypothetical protein